MRTTLATPAGFDFRRTVHSHGWYTLAPFEAPADAAWLETTVALGAGAARRIRLAPAGAGRVALESPGRVPADERRALAAAARRVLGLDVDLAGFHAAARERADTAWMAEGGWGRMLRCPTAWEDLVKLILTTNCTWALTTRMVEALIERWGERAADGTRGFPGPERLARVREAGFRAAGLGYRAPRLAELTRLVLRGEIEPSSWERDGADTAALREAILATPGAGPYVAENVLRLNGTPDGPGLDSWIRATYGRVYHGGRRVSDRTIVRRYARFGRWAGLALWCDMTRDWAEEGFEP